MDYYETNVLKYCQINVFVVQFIQNIRHYLTTLANICPFFAPFLMHKNKPSTTN
nr:MAG TPA: hypothetical protein [Caudoviricetes sp.]